MVLLSIKILALIFGLLVGFATGSQGAIGDYGYCGASGGLQKCVKENYSIYKVLWSPLCSVITMLLMTPIGFGLFFILGAIVVCFEPSVLTLDKTILRDFGLVVCIFWCTGLVGYFIGHGVTDNILYKLEKFLKDDE